MVMVRTAVFPTNASAPHFCLELLWTSTESTTWKPCADKSAAFVVWGRSHHDPRAWTVHKYFLPFGVEAFRDQLLRTAEMMFILKVLE